MDDKTARTLAAALGLGNAGVGLASVVAPRTCARLAGIPLGPNSGSELTVRALGVHDVALGLGLLAAATRGRDFVSWLLLGAAIDMGEAVSLMLALRAGVREPRLAALAATALELPAPACFSRARWASGRDARRGSRGPAGSGWYTGGQRPSSSVG
jgi:hypothetical protein